MIDRFRGEYAFLSNFYPCKIKHDGLQFNSVEAAYQAYKTEDLTVREAFQAYDAREAKKASKTLKVRKGWHQIKKTLMLDLLFIKFNDPVLQSKLLATGDEELQESNTWHDVYWGVCNGVGENMLGKMLMKIRQLNRAFGDTV